MMICNRCGEKFTEDEAGSRDYCYEEEYGVSGMFPDRHYGTYMVCPNCGSEDFDNYHEEEEED